MCLGSNDSAHEILVLTARDVTIHLTIDISQ